MRVLITGGSGYLGQFLLVALRSSHEVAYTYLGTPPDPDSCGGVQAFQVNIATGEGLTEAVLDWKPQVVVNCAAVSQPAACEQNYETCRTLNRPYKLVEALQQLQDLHGITALLIQLSTDQVYSGSAKPWWSESDAADPVNAYGRSKLEAEQLLQKEWQGRFVALRSSLIIGPEPPLAPVGRTLFLQFVRQVLEEGKQTTFFVDEYRCVVYVQDICAVVSQLISRAEHTARKQCQAEVAADDSSGCTLLGLPHSIYNMGGPDRVSRHDMAMAVARHCGLDSGAVLPARSADVKRAYNSPPDISMTVEQLLQSMPGTVLTPFEAALQQIFPRSS